MLKRLWNKLQELDPRLQVREGDVLIASYPKSGNTWTRFVLGHLLTDCREQLTFQNFDRYTPELGVHQQWLRQLESPRLLKTHQSYQPQFKKAIYLLRDPRDVYVSYYHYLRKHLPESMTFQTFLREEVVKRGTWANHVESWQQCADMQCIKYEDLLEEPQEYFGQLLDFIPEFALPKDKLATAVEMSAFDRMKKVEKDHGRAFTNKASEQKSTVFMRKGQKGDWQNYFTAEDEALLLTREGETMRRVGYAE